MGVLDAIKGLFSGEGVSGILESTGLGEHAEGLFGEGSAIADAAGVDLGQVTESFGLDGVVEALPGDLTPPTPEGLP